MRGLIITLPMYDDVTEYFSKYSSAILEEASKKGVPVKKVKGKEVNKTEIEKIFLKLNHKLVVLNGHGSSDVICGDQNEIIFKSGENDHLLKDRITYTRACEAGKVLGKTCIKDGQGCFIGYENKFRFLADPSKYHKPLKDDDARLFLDPSNLVSISILKGNTSQEAYNRSRTQILKNMKKALKNKIPGAINIVEHLYNNYKSQILVGNPEAKL